jgi:hypothetical protein
MAAASRWKRTGWVVNDISNTTVQVIDYRCTGCGERRGFDSRLTDEVLKAALKAAKCNCR